MDIETMSKNGITGIIIIGLVITLAMICYPLYAKADDDWTFKVGIAQPAYQSNAEFGSGPVLKLRAEYQIKEHLTFEIDKRSYIFEGKPFGDRMDSESSYVDFGITYEF